MTTRARVSMTVEILLKAEWSDDCTLAQVRQQAAQEAENKIRRLLSENLIGVSDIEVITVIDRDNGR